jgi:hypothetical protein
VAQESENAIAWVCNFETTSAMEFIKKIESVGMIATFIWLDEALEEEFDVRCANVELVAEMVIVR